jgi:2-polyprenyl-3-methyl-5-hydroxy-6-metoxy-1,4-benzoquinol methylase
METNKINVKKWDDYYINAQKSKTNPPWESDLPFHFLVDLIKSEKEYSSKIFPDNKFKFKNVIELGCGASASSIWMTEEGLEVTAVDISKEGIKRAKLKDKLNKVKWIEANILDDNFFETTKLNRETFDLVFDLQCFHVVRFIDEDRASNLIYNLLKPNGKLMVVCGADIDVNNMDSICNNSVSGPPRLKPDDFIIPLVKSGLKVLSIKLTKFNTNENYGENPPLCWVGLFEK